MRWENGDFVLLPPSLGFLKRVGLNNASLEVRTQVRAVWAQSAGLDLHCLATQDCLTFWNKMHLETFFPPFLVSGRVLVVFLIPLSRKKKRVPQLCQLKYTRRMWKGEKKKGDVLLISWFYSCALQFCDQKRYLITLQLHAVKCRREITSKSLFFCVCCSFHAKNILGIGLCDSLTCSLLPVQVEKWICSCEINFYAFFFFFSVKTKPICASFQAPGWEMK